MKQLLFALADFGYMAAFGFAMFAGSHFIELVSNSRTSIFSVIASAAYHLCAAVLCCYFVIGVCASREMRWYMVVGLLLGGVAYRLTLGRLAALIYRAAAKLAARLAAPLAAAWKAAVEKQRAKRLKRKQEQAILESGKDIQPREENGNGEK